MKIVWNNIIPFKGFKAINLFGILFVRGDAEISKFALNHERIHTAQMKEMLYAPFYLWYVIEWVIRLIQYKNAYASYRNISFEREAYDNDSDIEYLDKRTNYGFIKYLNHGI